MWASYPRGKKTMKEKKKGKKHEEVINLFLTADFRKHYEDWSGTYNFRWLGPSSLQHTNKGWLLKLAIQNSYRHDFADPPCRTPTTIIYSKLRMIIQTTKTIKNTWTSLAFIRFSIQICTITLYAQPETHLTQIWAEDNGNGFLAKAFPCDAQHQFYADQVLNAGLAQWC